MILTNLQARRSLPSSLSCRFFFDMHSKYTPFQMNGTNVRPYLCMLLADSRQSGKLRILFLGALLLFSFVL